jgi:hypothetical protein
MNLTSEERIVYCEDAINWLSSRPILEGCSLVGTLPDKSEFPILSLDEWKKWFFNTASLIMSKCPDDGVSIFYQTDIKFNGIWVDKSFLIQKAAEKEELNLLWHKIILRAPPGTITFGMPSYSHILCFSKNLRADVSKSTPDILPTMGEKTWRRGMGINASIMIAKFIASQTQSHTVVNPFCGQGSVLAGANALGLKAIGIEKSPKRAMKSKGLKISQDFKEWAL